MHVPRLQGPQLCIPLPLLLAGDGLTRGTFSISFSFAISAPVLDKIYI